MAMILLLFGSKSERIYSLYFCTVFHSIYPVKNARFFPATIPCSRTGDANGSRISVLWGTPV